MNFRFAWAILLCLFATGASGETYVLDSDGTGDFPTLQAAIDAAASGDVIELLDGVYTGTGNRDVYFAGRAVTVRSQSGDPASCVIDCQGTPGDYHRGFNFYLDEQASTALENLTITNGYMNDGSGAIQIESASPTISGCVLLYNVTTHRGGGLYCLDSSPLVTNCVFRGNSADVGGGMYGANPSTPLVNGCVFEDNTADVAGAFGASSYCTPVLDSCVFIGNVANGFGGAMYSSNSQPSVDNCTFVSNTAGFFAACIGGSFPSQIMVITNSIMAFNGNGEPVWVEDGLTPVFLCSNIFGNEDGDWVGSIEGQAGQNGNISSDPFFCDFENDDLNLQTESECLPENNSCGELIGALPGGCSITAVPDFGLTSQSIRVRCYPNPFNPQTTIAFDLPRRELVNLRVFDMTGHLVKELVVGEEYPPGLHEVVWNGRDDTGRQVASGIYFYRLNVGGFSETKRMVLIK